MTGSDTQTPSPPVAKRVETIREHHGDVFIDPYEWLREKSNPEVIAYLEAENDYVDQSLAHLEPLRQKIFDEIKARTKETDLSVPTRQGDWWYYSRTFEGKQYRVQCRCPVTNPDDWDPPILDENTEIPGEQILLDSNEEADGHDFFALGAALVSLDANLLAYSVDIVGDERYTLRFKDLRTGEKYPDEIADIAGGVTWAADNRTVYYLTLDDAHRPDKVWRYRLGSGEPSELVYHEADERFWLGAGLTRSEAYVFIASGSSITSEVRYADSADPQAEFTVVLPRREGVEYSVEHAVVGGQDRFLILHNDGAVNFTLTEAPVSDPTQQRTLIPHRDDVRLEAADAFAGHLVVSYRRAALPRIQLWPIGSDGDYAEPEEIAFDSELMSSGLGGNPNWVSPKLRIRAGSLVTPLRVYDIDLGTGERTLLREQPVLGDYRPNRLRRTARLGARRRRHPDPGVDRAPGRPRISGAHTASTATAPTRYAQIQPFPSRGCRCWTGAWCSSSPTSAAAERWAGCGTSTESCWRRRTLSPTSSRWHSIWWMRE